MLKMTAGLAAAGVIPCGAAEAASAQSSWRATVEPAQPKIDKPERLFIKNQRTGDVFNDIVKQGPLIFQDAYAELDHLMRDWRRDEVISMDRGLIDLLLKVQGEVGHDEPITLISGYRSKSTNDMLRRKIRKVAKNSYHIKGMAVDLRIKGVSTGALRQVALHQHVGGVGYYPSKGFIHLDTGPIRTWRG